MDRQQLQQLAESVWPHAVEARRHLHRNPELSFQEEQTAAYIAAQLREMGYEPQTGIGGHGVKAVLRGGRGPGPTIGLRADIDALPIQEETGLPFASCKPGVMHACGHDVHTATLLGAARALRQLQPELRGQVVLVFQPGEESNPGGASLMIRDGVLENPRIEAMFGLHVWPYEDAGIMTFGAGPMLAAPDEFEIRIAGRGGHAARPHQTVDAVYVGAQLIVALQGIVSRSVNPMQPAVLTVGALHAGSKHNIIAGEAVLQGTIRTMDEGVRELMHRRLREVCEGICAAYGATCEVAIDTGYPVLVNDAAMTEVARQAARAALGEANVKPMEAGMGGEDFAFFLQHVPGSFARLGSARPGTPPQQRYGLHTPKLDIDERCMVTGVAYYLSLVRQFLNGAA